MLRHPNLNFYTVNTKIILAANPFRIINKRKINIIEMLSSYFVLNSIAEYITEKEVHLRHGWFQVKMDGVINATPVETREEVMNRIDFIISRP